MNWLALRGALREHLGRGKVVVYTAFTGDYDTVHAPATKVPGWDYLCFSDETSTVRPGWDVRLLSHEYLDQIRRARVVKILPHQFLPKYDISIWIDGNIGIRGDLAAFSNMALAHADIAFF